MADFYLHCKLADALSKSIKYPFKKEILYIAAQGPDPFYYVLSKKYTNKPRKIADLMHDTATGLMLTNIVKEVKRNLTPETYTFLVGFVSHYVLDITIHPYVYYHVGEYDKNNPETYEYRGLHVKFERSIDYDIMQRDLKKKPHTFKFYKTYFPAYNLPTSVSDIVARTVYETYHIGHSAEIYQLGVQTMQKVLKRYAYDRFGLKKALFKIIDLFNRKQDLLLQDISLYNHTSDFDYINVEHRAWHHPVTNEIHKDSVLMLYQKALKDAKDMMTEINDYIFNNKKVNFKNLFPNISFNSGMPCGEKIQYFNNYTKM